MDDLTEFLQQQQVLANMPEGDIDEYEARMRLRAKREKLWKSAEHVASPSQKEHEDAELVAYIESLAASADDPSDSLPTGTGTGKEMRPSRESPRNVMANDSVTNDDEYATSKYERSPPGHQATSAKSNAHNTLNLEHLKTTTMPVSSEQLAFSPPSDIARHNDDMFLSPAFVGNEASSSLVPAQNYAGLSDSRRPKVSKNERLNLREKVLKKRKASDFEEPNVADVSNITSPSKSPAKPSPSIQSPRVLRPRPTLDTIRKEKRARKAERDKEAAARRKEEEEEKKMTPREYAVRVQSKFTAYLEKTAREKLPLRDKSIFYIGGDYHTASQGTRKKMDHLRKKGATVVPTYSPDTVTHIITEGNTAVTLKALGLKSLDEIPIYIPTLTWSWVTEGRTGSPEFWFAAFPSRIDASSDKRPEDLGMSQSGARELLPTPSGKDEISRIEDFTVLEHAAPSQSGSVSASNQQSGSDGGEQGRSPDPLAEFYAQAHKEAEEENPLHAVQRPDDDSLLSSAVEKPKSKFTCDKQPVRRDQCINRDIVAKLSELEEINKTKVAGDPSEQRWRVFSYGKSIRAIREYPKRIRNYEDAISIKGVGHKTAEKIVEIIKTGDLGRIKYDNTEDVQIIKSFTDIYGVGLGTAQKWYAVGCRTLDDIKNKKGGIKVSEVQELGLKYYDDINTRIPCKEVEEIYSAIKSIALSIDPKLFIELMGSYRRGADTCGDVDILMSRPTDDGRTHQGVLRVLLKELHLQRILTEDLAVPDDLNDLEQTYRGLCRLNNKGPMRRIDILAVPYHERGGALIYYTGDDIFNRAIRLKAKSMGYSLSQHGLSKRVSRDHRGKKMVPAEIIASETEEEIFRILGVPWQEPHERIRAQPRRN